MTGRILLLAVLVSAIMANANGAFASTPGLDRFLVSSVRHFVGQSN